MYTSEFWWKLCSFQRIQITNFFTSDWSDLILSRTEIAGFLTIRLNSPRVFTFQSIKQCNILTEFVLICLTCYLICF